LFNADTAWWIADAEMIGLVRDEQAARYVDDPWQEPIAKFVRSQTDVSIGEVLSNLLIERGRWTQGDQNRVARCLKVLARLGARSRTTAIAGVALPSCGPSRKWDRGRRLGPTTR
jgi:predicted P-loop ATPase